MANLIDETYFTGARALPIKSEDDLDLLDEFIEEKQNEFFIKVFGYEFQKTMLAEASETIYKRILEGEEFTDSKGYLQKWEGVNNSLANYVYFYYNKELILKRTSTGFSAGKIENGVAIDPISQPVRIFNRIPKAFIVLQDLLNVYDSDYPTLLFKPIKPLNEFNI